MYLEHFRIRDYPFSLNPNPDYFCELPGHQAALNVLLVSLRSGEGFIKIIGEVGSGKTLICRLLMDHLGPEFYTTYIPNPDLTPDGLRRALARELGLSFPSDLDAHSILEHIYDRLLELHRKGKHVVLLIDEAQTLCDQSLEALRLLTNLETSTTKLLQVVLFAQPELDQKLAQAHLRQLKQRITFSYYLPPISKNDLNAYICHRLAKAGFTYGQLFTPHAQNLLYRRSKGLPRVINILCHKAMMTAYGRGDQKVNVKAMRNAIADTEGTPSKDYSNLIFWLFSSTAAIIVLIALIIKYHGLNLL